MYFVIYIKLFLNHCLAYRIKTCRKKIEKDLGSVLLKNLASAKYEKLIVV